MRRVARQAFLSLLLILSVPLAACSGKGARPEFSGQFEEIALANAPAEMQTQFERMKAVPGLYVLREGADTYLLLTAGRAEVPGRRLAVVEIRKPSGQSGEARLIASLQPESQAGEYLSLVVRLQAPADMQFVARLPQGEQVVELRGMPIPVR